MAVKGAHLTGTAFIRPSIFEIIAQESFASTLEPAFKKIFSFLVTCNVERYGHLLRWADEGFLLFNAILQRYYFRKYSASFSETFYGLKRIGLIDSKVKRKLSKEQEILSLVALVLFPYVKSKLYALAQKYKIDEIDGRIPETRWDKLRRSCVIKGYTTGCMLYETITLYNYLLYISGRSMYPTPLLKLLSVTLTYAEPQTIVSVSELLRKIKNNSFGLSDGVDILQRSVTRTIEFGAFFLQFLAWWSEENSYVNVMNLPVPPPPQVPKVAEQYKGVCPICLKEQHIHTVLSVSGYAFCYQCILPVVRKTGRCPVTSYPATEDDLIRLYID